MAVNANTDSSVMASTVPMVGAYVMSYIKEGGLTAAVGKMLNTVAIELRLENKCTKGIEQL